MSSVGLAIAAAAAVVEDTVSHPAHAFASHYSTTAPES